MSCEQIIEYIQRDLDEDLSGEEAIKLEEHLRICSDCQKFNDRLKKLNQQLLVLPEVEPPISIVDQFILPKLEGKNQIKPSFFAHYRKPLTFAGCAAIIFASLWGVKDHFAKVTENNRQVALAPKTGTGETTQPLKRAEKPNEFTKDQALVKSPSEAPKEVQKPTSRPTASGNGSMTGKAAIPKVKVKPMPEKAVAIASQPKVTESAEKPLAASADNASKQAAPSTKLEPKTTALAVPNTMAQDTRTLVAPQTLMANNNPPMKPVIFPSPYSPLIAKVEGNNLIVSDGEGKIIYQSHKWDGNQAVSVSWMDENHLVYELTSEAVEKTQTFHALTMETSEKWSVNLKVGQEQKE